MGFRITALRNLAFQIPLETQEHHQQSLGLGGPKTVCIREVDSSSEDQGQESGLSKRIKHGSGAPSVICYSWRSYWKKTLIELDEEFGAIRRRWDASTDCKALVAQIERLAPMQQKKLLLDNIVALGIGSFHSGPQKGISLHAGFQLAAILTIRDTLNGESKTASPFHLADFFCSSLLEMSDTPLPCVIQDPDYSEIEKTYLRSLGLDVVDDPDAYSRIDTESLVFHIAGYFEFAWWIAEGPWPAVMITDDWGNPRPELVEPYPAYLVTFVHGMFQHYDHEPFAVSADGPVSCGEGVDVYTRKPPPIRVQD